MTYDFVQFKYQIKVESNNAADVAPEAEYKYVAFNWSGTLTTTLATFKLTMSLPSCITGLALDRLNVVDTVYNIDTSTAIPVTMDAPTYTITPAGCADTYSLSIHPTNDLATAAPGYLSIIDDAGTKKV